MTGERLLLIGAGHAHLHLIKQADRLRCAGYTLTLVAPRWFHYSGTASAVATGDLDPRRGRVDVAALARRCGVTHHQGMVEDLDPTAHTAGTDTGAALAWDVLSCNIGSVADPGTVQVGPGVLRVKPLEGLAVLAERLRPPSDGRPLAVTVVGGGGSGVEIAAHVAARLRATAVPGAVVLVHAGADVVPDLPTGARRRLERTLERAGVRICRGVGARRVEADRAELGDGTTVRHDVAVLATGLTAPGLVHRSGLGDAHGIPVGASLRHREHDDVYAVGDCAHFLPRPLPRIGVHGVRQGPVLLEALLARAGGAPAPSYRPQAVALSILDLGGGRAMAVRGDWWWEGRLALRLKRHIDRRWLRQYEI